MWEDLTKLTVSPLDLIIRAFVVYFAIVILLRISGKRQLGQMGATEFVVMLLISNAVQNSLNAGDSSLVGGLILATSLIFMSWTISQLTFRSKRMSRIFEGTPTLLIHKGKVLEENLVRERLSISEFKVLLRRQGFHDTEIIQTAVLESDGHLSVVASSSKAAGANASNPLDDDL